mmetsp:Transcript_29943/g.69062  ORF Transcript_29943/g.69062 Transcript_29943/m.69062 type:complete len:93 (-) Transcript_29943:12-290(-)
MPDSEEETDEKEDDLNLPTAADDTSVDMLNIEGLDAFDGSMGEVLDTTGTLSPEPDVTNPTVNLSSHVARMPEPTGNHEALVDDMKAFKAFC